MFYIIDAPSMWDFGIPGMRNGEGRICMYDDPYPNQQIRRFELNVTSRGLLPGKLPPLHFSTIQTSYSSNISDLPSSFNDIEYKVFVMAVRGFAELTLTKQPCTTIDVIPEKSGPARNPNVASYKPVPTNRLEVPTKDPGA